MRKGFRTPLLQISLVILFGFATSYSGAQERGPSTAEERARAVRTAHALQTDPLSPEVLQDRQWFMTWLIQVPDITVSFCPDIIGDLGDDDNRGALVASEMASEAVFMIEHPDKTKQSAAVHLAGAEGVLNTYQAIRQKDPKYHIKQLDDMAQRRDQGKLADYVGNVTKKCKR